MWRTSKGVLKRKRVKSTLGVRRSHASRAGALRCQQSNARGHLSDSRSGAHGGSAHSWSRKRGRSSHHRHSCSPIHTPSPARSGATDWVLTLMHRNWEDIPEYPDYSKIVQFADDSDAEGRPKSKVAEVSKTTEALLRESCLRRLANNTRLKIRDNYYLPQVAATRTPQLDNYLKLEISQQAKTTDKELAKIQTFVLDSLATLSHLGIGCAGPWNHPCRSYIYSEGHHRANWQCQCHLRRSKIISQLNKSFIPLIKEDSNFEDVAPSLFGPEFAHKSKEHVEEVNALRSSAGATGLEQPFFRQGPLQPGGTLLQTRENRLPDFPEGEPTVPTETSVGQINNSHVCMFNYLIMNFKSTLACHIRGLGVKPTQMTDLPLAGRLVYFFQSWSVITQDRWVLNTAQGYQINFVLEPPQKSLPTPPHHSSAQS